MTRHLVVLIVSIGVAGCAVTDITQYYALGQDAPRRTESRVSASIAPSGPGSVDATGTVGIGVGPIIVPAYLRRTQIVTRTGADQLDVATFHRWAEPLEDGIARILAEEIGSRVPTERIATFPWRGAVARSLEYQVVVAVMRLDGRRGGEVTLDTRWRVLGKEGDELAVGRSTVVEAVSGQGHEPVVAAMTRAVANLGQEIAVEIRAMRSPK